MASVTSGVVFPPLFVQGGCTAKGSLLCTRAKETTVYVQPILITLGILPLIFTRKKKTLTLTGMQHYIQYVIRWV